MPIIQIENVSKTIRRTQVLSHVTLELDSGRIYGLRGHNGSGKTMIMRIIAGLVSPTSGTVRICGQELDRRKPYPTSIGVLIESPAFLPRYTGRANLRIIASIRNQIADSVVDEALEKVGLDPNDKRKYSQYSLGMKQRLGIACAVMESPSIVLLDEPFNALDEKGVEETRLVIREQKARGATVVLACHDRLELDAIADDIVEMSGGRTIP